MGSGVGEPGGGAGGRRLVGRGSSCPAAAGSLLNFSFPGAARGRVKLCAGTCLGPGRVPPGPGVAPPCLCPASLWVQCWPFRAGLWRAVWSGWRRRVFGARSMWALVHPLPEPQPLTAQWGFLPLRHRITISASRAPVRRKGKGMLKHLAHSYTPVHSPGLRGPKH